MKASTLIKKTDNENQVCSLGDTLIFLDGAHDGGGCAEPYFANKFAGLTRADVKLEPIGLHHRYLTSRPILNCSSKKLYGVATALLECYGGVLGTILNGVPFNYKKINADGFVIGSKLTAYTDYNIATGCMELDNFYEALFNYCNGTRAYLPVDPNDIRQNLYFAYDERTFYDAIKEGLFYNSEAVILFDPMGSTTWHKTEKSALTVSGGILIRVNGFYTTNRGKIEGILLNFNQLRSWDFARHLYSKAIALGMTPGNPLKAAAEFNYYGRYFI